MKKVNKKRGFAMKTIVVSARIFGLSIVLLASGKTTCTKFGSDSATLSTSITIQNQSSYGLSIAIETIGTNNQSSFTLARLESGKSQDVLRISNGMTTKGITFTTLDNKLKGSYTIGGLESIITITNDDLK